MAMFNLAEKHFFLTSQTIAGSVDLIMKFLICAAFDEDQWEAVPLQTGKFMAIDFSLFIVFLGPTKYQHSVLLLIEMNLLFMLGSNWCHEELLSYLI